MSCVLGFDVGSRLTGVAIGNRLTATARALAVVAVRDDQPDWDRLDALQREVLRLGAEQRHVAVEAGVTQALDGVHTGERGPHHHHVAHRLRLYDRDGADGAAAHSVLHQVAQ